MQETPTRGDPRWDAKIQAHDRGLDQTEGALADARRALGLAANALWAVYFAAYSRDDGEQLIALRRRILSISGLVGEAFKDVQQHGMTEADVAEGPCDHRHWMRQADGKRRCIIVGCGAILPGGYFAPGPIDERDV